MKIWAAGEAVNAADINGNFVEKFGYISSETLTGNRDAHAGDFTVPAGANYVFFAISWLSLSDRYWKGEGFLARAGKTTSYNYFTTGQNGETKGQILLALVGDAITITETNSSADYFSYSITAYYYS